MVNAWNVGELDQMVLPPCHFSFQCYSHEKYGKRYLSLAWNQRSCDVGLGIPFNIASYGLLLEIIAKEVNMIPDELIGNLGDVHLYKDHIEPIKEQLTREPYSLPTLKINTEFWQTESGECGVGPLKTNLQGFELSDFILENYKSYPTIKLPLSN
jgi:thymidylate synthase